MKRAFVFLMIYTVLVITVYVFLQHRVNSIVNAHLDEERARNELVLNASIQSFQILSDILLNEVIKKESVLEILHEIVYGDVSKQGMNRGRLYRALFESYGRVKKQSIRQLHFHYPDGRSLLRFHYPEKSNDLLADIRPSVARAGQGIATHGFEDGKVFSGFRHVYPLYQGGTPVGSVELSNGFYHLNKMLSMNDNVSNEYRMMIQKKSKFFDQLFQSQRELYEESVFSKDYVYEKPESDLFREAEKNCEIPGYVVALKKKLNLQSDFHEKFNKEMDFSLPIRLDGLYYSVHFHSVLNTIGKHAGYIIMFEKDGFSKDLHRRSLMGFFITSGLLFFILLFLFAAVKYKAAEKRTAKQMLMISDNVLEGIYITDEKGRVIFINAAAMEMLGFQEQELLHKNAHDMFHVDSEGHSRETCFVMESIHSGDQLRFDEVIFKTKAGADFCVELSCTPLSRSGRITKTINVFHDITEKKQKDDELKAAHHALKEVNMTLVRQVESDGLTGIANRRSFDKTFDRVWRSSQRDGASMSVLFIDIDYFKLYNDSYGHNMGDECLIKIAKAIESSCLRPGDIAARYGGEEFVVLLPDTLLENAIFVAKRIQKNIADLNISHEASAVSHSVTASIGIYSNKWSENSSVEAFLVAADEKLYEAKGSGRNQIAY